MKVKLPFQRVQNSMCKLTLFTWACVESSSHKDVAPICPDHVRSRVRSGALGTDVVVVCEAGRHLIGLCRREEFEAEREQAEAKLLGDTTAGEH